MSNRLTNNINSTQLCTFTIRKPVLLTLLPAFLIACSSQSTQPRNEQVRFENDRSKFIEEVFFLTDVPELVPVVLEVPQYPEQAFQKLEGSCDASFALRPVAGPSMNDLQLYGTYDVRVGCPEDLEGLEKSCRESVRNWHFVHKRTDLMESQEHRVESFCLFNPQAINQKHEDRSFRQANELSVPQKAGRFKRVETGFVAPKPFDRSFKYEISERSFYVNAVVSVIEDTALDYTKMAARDTMLQKQAHPKTEFLFDEPIMRQLGQNKYRAIQLRTRHTSSLENNDIKVVTETYIIRYGRDILHIKIFSADKVFEQIAADVDQLLNSVVNQKQRPEK